jgi:hypothetical protein
MRAARRSRYKSSKGRRNRITLAFNDQLRLVSSLNFNSLLGAGMAKKATPPCACGYLGHHSGRCHCTPDQVVRYRARVSGPLLDRIDLHVEVPALPERDLVCAPLGESSKAVRE